MNKTILGLSVAAMVFGLLTVVLNQAEAGTMEKDSMMMKKHPSLRGDLTSPADDKPFGGEDVGDYSIRISGDDKIRVLVKLDITPADGSVLEGWLVDVDSDYKLSLGKANQRNWMVFGERMVNPWIYDVLVITEEPMNDTDPSPNTPVGGVPLAEPFGQ